MNLLKKKKYTILSVGLKYMFVFIFISAFLFPLFVTHADVQVSSGIENPLGPSITDIPSFIKVVIDFVLFIGVPIIALAIIYSGFLFVTAQGNSEKLTTAKKTLLYTIIGAALLLGSFVIANAIKGTVDDIKSST
jgi:hypothetical protein